MNRVKIEILGNNYMIQTNESEEYCQKLADEINSQVGSFMQQNPKISAHDALILCTLGCYDSFHKSEKTCDSLRDQLSEFLISGKRRNQSQDTFDQQTF